MPNLSNHFYRAPKVTVQRGATLLDGDQVDATLNSLKHQKLKSVDEKGRHPSCQCCTTLVESDQCRYQRTQLIGSMEHHDENDANNADRLENEDKC